MWDDCINKWPDARILGLDATPLRSDNTGLWRHFEDIVCGPSIRYLTDAKFLAPIQIVAPPFETEKGQLTDVAKAWGDFCRGRRTVLFSVNVKHGAELETKIRAMGGRPQQITSRTPTDTRDRAIDDFAAGRIDTIINCDILTEGYDCPAADTVMIAKKTKSLSLYMQMIGRGMRPAPDKICLVIDCGGSVWQHGMPDADREWDLRGLAKSHHSQTPPMTLRQCKCGGIVPQGAQTCPVCGTDLSTYQLPPERAAIKMARLDAEKVARHKADAKSRQRKAWSLAYSLKDATPADYEAIGRKHGMAPGWGRVAMRVVQQKAKARRPH